MHLETSMICLDLSLPRERAACAFDVGARTDAGRVRANNEDCLFTVPEMGLFVLSDGMGGLARGEMASQLTVNTIIDHCQQADNDPSLPLAAYYVKGSSQPSNRLVSAIHLANRAVYRASCESAVPGEMGATVVAVRCHDGHVSIAHAGDSRAYRLRNGGLQQLTQDHSLAAEQARLGFAGDKHHLGAAYQNLLTRAVGIALDLTVEVTEDSLCKGDTLLLCSDGLTHELSDKQIAAVLSNSRDAQTAADQLVDLANQAGGGDNITVVVIRPLPPPGTSSRGRLRRWLLGSEPNPQER